MTYQENPCGVNSSCSSFLIRKVPNMDGFALDDHISPTFAILVRLGNTYKPAQGKTVDDPLTNTAVLRLSCACLFSERALQAYQCSAAATKCAPKVCYVPCSTK